MNLIKDKWSKEDIGIYYEYLESLTLPEKIPRTTRIINTKLPVLAIPNGECKKIAKEIFKGNYESFLAQLPYKYYEATLVVGYIICMINDFSSMEHYLDIHTNYLDNWSSVDCLPFKMKKKESLYFNLVNKYRNSDKPFVRRLGLGLLFNLIRTGYYVDETLEIIDEYNNENEYYVNMVIAWLLCDMFIYQRDKVISYLSHHHLNKFVINKFISKCRDSYRISDSDKLMLLQYKIK